MERDEAERVQVLTDRYTVGEESDAARQLVVRLFAWMEVAESSREQVITELQRGYDTLTEFVQEVAWFRGGMDGVVAQVRGFFAVRTTTEAMVLRWWT